MFCWLAGYVPFMAKNSTTNWNITMLMKACLYLFSFNGYKWTLVSMLYRYVKEPEATVATIGILTIAMTHLRRHLDGYSPAIKHGN